MIWFTIPCAPPGLGATCKGSLTQEFPPKTSTESRLCLGLVLESITRPKPKMYQGSFQQFTFYRQLPGSFTGIIQPATCLNYWIHLWRLSLGFAVCSCLQDAYKDAARHRKVSVPQLPWSPSGEWGTCLICTCGWCCPCCCRTVVLILLRPLLRGSLRVSKCCDLVQ